MQKSILLVDDDLQFRNLVVPILKEHGYRVAQASNGMQALSACQMEKFDVAIIDGELPDTEGPILIEKLQQRIKDTKFVYISAHWRDTEYYDRLTKQLKVLLVLHKPIKPMIFGLQIDNLFENKVSEAPTEAQSNTTTKLRALTEDYTRTLPDAITEVANIVRQAREQNNNPQLLADVITSAHKLRGTAGTHGLPDVGLAMGVIEDNVRELSRTQDHWSRQGFWEIIDNALQSATAAGEKVRMAQKEAMPTGTVLPKVLFAGSQSSFNSVSAELKQSGVAELIMMESASDVNSQLEFTQIDAAILEIRQLSKQHAFDLSNRIHDCPGYEKLPIAFVLPAGDTIYGAEAIHANITTSIPEPFTASTCLNAIKDLLSSSKKNMQSVLVVDDDPGFLKRVEVVLGQDGVTVISCVDSARAIATAEASNPDIILLDVDMPGLSGYDVGQMLRTYERWQNTPILFVTARASWEARTTAYSSGGNDFINKPIVDTELRGKVKIWLDRVRFLAERDSVDALSGLLLHGKFVESLSKLVSKSQEGGGELSICLLDIEGLAKTNEQYNAGAGDSVLAYMGKLIQRRFRSGELRARWSGHQFALAFAGEEKGFVEQAVKLLVKEFKEHEFSIGSHTFKVGCRYALAFYPANGSTAYELMHHAETDIRAIKSMA